MFAVAGVRAIRYLIARNWLFTTAFLLGLVMRLITVLGFPPAIWFAGDSIAYVNDALTHKPSLSREAGYSVMLMALQPLHSFAVVTAVQHLMGLGIGAMSYALLRRHGLPRWGATLATLPVLLDAYVIQLEHEMLPDIPFAFLVMGAVTLVAWWRDGERPAWVAGAAAALIAFAATCWPVGLPLLIVLVVTLALRKAGWRAVTAAVVGGALPLGLYLAWFDVAHDHVAFNYSSGAFLWSRTTTFADCQIIKPPAEELPLCPHTPVGQRRTASLWIWEKDSPLLKLGGRFTPRTNALAENFARRAILAQPLGYARAVLDGFALTFTWNRPPHPTKLMSERYQFTLATNPWDSGARAANMILVQREYTGGHLGFARAVHPFSPIMIAYQRFMYVRGTMTGIFLLLGLGAIARAWRGGRYRQRRDWGGPALFPWLIGLGVLLVPVMSADFSLRYVVPALPAVSLAAAFLFLRPVPVMTPRPAEPRAPRPEFETEDQRTSTGPLPAQA
jgi:hypothetical protein